MQTSLSGISDGRARYENRVDWDGRKRVLLCTGVGEAWACLFPEGDRPLYNKLEREKRDAMFDAARFCRSDNGN